MQLGIVIKRWRIMSEIDLRTAAALIGLKSQATLARIENGQMPAGENLATILRWLMNETNLPEGDKHGGQ